MNWLVAKNIKIFKIVKFVISNLLYGVISRSFGVKLMNIFVL